MFQTIINFFFPTVAGVMASFQKTITDLNKVAAHHTDKANAAIEQAEDYYDKGDAQYEKAGTHTQEARSAAALAARMNKTFGLDQ